MSARIAPVALALAMLLVPTLAPAQDEDGSAVSAADADKGMDLRPASIKVGSSSLGQILIDARGRTLYAMDARIVRARYGAGANYCRDACAEKWIALAAPKGATPVGRWKVIEGGVGPQWAWNNDPVFTYAADSGSGSVAGQNYDDLWTVITYVPPMPTVTAPAAVSIVFADGAYQMTDDQGRKLFTADCANGCKDWQRLGAGLANRDVGPWQVSREGDRAHWLYKGKQVFVASGDMPSGAMALRP